MTELITPDSKSTSKIEAIADGSAFKKCPARTKRSLDLNKRSKLFFRLRHRVNGDQRLPEKSGSWSNTQVFHNSTTQIKGRTLEQGERFQANRPLQASNSRSPGSIYGNSPNLPHPNSLSHQKIRRSLCGTADFLNSIQQLAENLDREDPANPNQLGQYPCSLTALA